MSRVRDTVEGALAHQQVASEAILSELRLERDMSRHPLFQVRFDFRDRTSEATSGIALFEIESPPEQFDLHVEFQETRDEITGRFSYSTDLFEDATITRLIEHFRILLENAVADPSIAISKLPMLSD